MYSFCIRFAIIRLHYYFLWLCRAVNLVEVVTEDVFDHVPGLGYVQISDVFTRNITFEPVDCDRRTVVFISCASPGNIFIKLILLLDY